MPPSFWRQIHFHSDNVYVGHTHDADVGGIAATNDTDPGATQSFVPTPRAAHSCSVFGTKLIVFGGWNGKQALDDVCMFDTDRVKWSKVHTRNPSIHSPPPQRNARFQNNVEPLNYNDIGPLPRNNHASVSYGFMFFVHGGHDGQTWLNDLYYLDVGPIFAGNHDTQLTWVKPDVNGTPPSSRACHSLTRIQDRLFMFGGFNGSGCFNDIDILDLATWSWIRPKINGPMPQARNAHSIVVVDQKNLYLFGGHSGIKHLTDLWVLDTTQLTWTQPAIGGDPPPGLRGHTACLVGSKMHLFGGYDGKRRSEQSYIFDVATLKWLSTRKCGSCPIARQRHSSAVVGNLMYIFGGFDGERWLNDLHVFDAAALERHVLAESAVSELVSNQRRHLFKLKEFADISIVVEDKEIPAHKAILASQCSYFYNMFSSEMKEKHTDRVVIADYSYAAVEVLIEFLYTGKLSKKTDSHVLLQVLGMAEQFLHFRLKAVCESQLSYAVTDENVVSIYIFADRYQANELKNSCESYICRHRDRLHRAKRLDDLKNSKNSHLAFSLFINSAFRNDCAEELKHNDTVTPDFPLPPDTKSSCNPCMDLA